MRRRGRPTLVIWVPALVSLVVSLVEILHRGVASPYDTGVYFDAACQFATGWTPYRDFVFVQPSGILYWLTPAALVAQHVSAAAGLLVARLTAALAAAGAVGLLAYILRRRRSAAWFAAMTLAVAPSAIAAAAQVKIEPFLLVAVMAGVAALDPDGDEPSDRRVRWAAIFFGLALATKLWAFFPIVAWLIIAPPRRGARMSSLTWLALGVFWASPTAALLDPRAIWHDVVMAQATRHGGPRIPSWRRLDTLVDLHHLSPSLGVALAVVVGLGWVAMTVTLWRHGGRLHRLVALNAAFGAVIALVPVEFYSYYAYYVDAWLIVGLSLVVTPLLATSTLRRVTGGVLVASLAAVTFVSYPSQTSDVYAYETAIIRHYVSPTECVFYSIPLVGLEAGRIDRPSLLCPLVVDPFGVSMALNANEATHHWESTFARYDVLVLGPLRTSLVPLTPALRQWLRVHFVEVYFSPGTLYILKNRTDAPAPTVSASRIARQVNIK